MSMMSGGPRRPQRNNQRPRRPSDGTPPDGAQRASQPGPDHQRNRQPPITTTSDIEVRGYALTRPDGVMVIREAQRPINALAPGTTPDAIVPPGFALSRGVRVGDAVLARVSVTGRTAQTTEIMEIDGHSTAEAVSRPRFDQLTAIYPDRAINLTRPGATTGRVLGLFSPIGFGSRVLVVSPPKAGKTTVLREIGLAVIANHPNARLICCLIGERPEEATEFSRLLPVTTATGTPVEVVATTFDDATSRHAALADLTAERARRLVEDGHDVVLLIDSITRLVRAHNAATTGRGAGRTLSGGVSAGALAPSRRFFGAARATDEGPSLTVIASVLVGTESRQDDVVYEELKGTGNSEIVLSRRLAERRVFPAIDLRATGTRREELLIAPDRLEAIHRARRAVAAYGDAPEAMTRLIETIELAPNDEDLMRRLIGRSGPTAPARGRV